MRSSHPIHDDIFKKIKDPLSYKREMEELIEDILLHVFSFLDIPSLIRSMRVCKRWKRDIDSEREWRWRFYRLQLEDLRFSTYSIKRLVIIIHSMIHAMRRFIEDPEALESKFIDDVAHLSLNKTSMLLPIENLKRELGLKANWAIARRIFGSRWYAGEDNTSSAWLHCLQETLANVGVSTKDVYHVADTQDAVLIYPHSSSATVIGNTISYRYLVWKALRERWGHKDVNLVKSSENLRTLIRQTLNEGLVIKFG